MIKQQKNLADATINQAVQMKRIALALEDRNAIERERNIILERKYSKKYQQTHNSSNIDYEDVSVIGINDIE
ncbi:unnamed protein product [Macrosiphum euphorbiae]|uniref:Uncharacterized protein n=1 Tax=Macrosiphum euphorbiae TaxID=13131 RepID=A0AAV0XUM6_9HEMI|nr:unnamed protein product [Macrosiphum euphorbiae]